MSMTSNSSLNGQQPKQENITSSGSPSPLSQNLEKTGQKCTEKVCKKLLSNINYSQSRNSVSNRPVKANELTVELLQKKFEEQDGKCYWSHIELNEEHNFVKHHPLAISVERLDNKKDYTYENTVLALRLFNLGRMAFPADQFTEVIKELTIKLNETTN